MFLNRNHWKYYKFANYTQQKKYNLNKSYKIKSYVEILIIRLREKFI